jgi:hypothetical protein
LTFLAIYLAMDLIRSSRIGIDRDAKNLGSTISLAVDQHLSARLGGLQMLAASPLVDDTRRHRELYQSAQGFYLSFSSHVILADPAGQMLFNTRVDFDLPLPPLPRPAGRSCRRCGFWTRGPTAGGCSCGAGDAQKQCDLPVAFPGRNAAVRCLPAGRTDACRLAIDFEGWQWQCHLATRRNCASRHRCLCTAPLCFPIRSGTLVHRSGHTPYRVPKPLVDHRLHFGGCHFSGDCR